MQGSSESCTKRGSRRLVHSKFARLLVLANKNKKDSIVKRVRKLAAESLESRRVLAASLGWDGPGTGSAELQYYIGEAPSYLQQVSVEQAIETALGAWSDVADIDFIRTDSPGQADSIDFNFRPLDGAGGTLAQAYFPDDINPARIAGDIEFDTEDRWEIGNGLGRSAFDLVSVAVHEIGHSLGLRHSHDSESILAPAISPNEQFVGLSGHDIEAIRGLYATRTENPDDTAVNDPDPADTNRMNPWNRSRWSTGEIDVNIFVLDGGGGLNAEISPRFNIYHPTDVNGDHVTSPVDALTVIDALNRGIDLQELQHQCDTNGDSVLSPVDALRIINRLNGGEDESAEPFRAPESNLGPGMGESEQPADPGAENESPNDGEQDEERTRPHLPIPGLLAFGLGNGGFLDSAVDILFEEFDENSDGNLAEGEVPMFVWSYLQRQEVDANGDNLVTLGEIDDALEAHRMERFNQVDDNQDGVLTADELPELLWRRIENADVDGNGVSFEELEMYRMLSRFEQLDDNSDQAITQNEVSERLWAWLSQYDANEDGQVAEEELPRRRDPLDHFARLAEMAARAFRRFR